MINMNKEEPKTVDELYKEWALTDIKTYSFPFYLFEAGHTTAIKQVLELLRSEKEHHEKRYEAEFWADWLESRIK